MAGRAVAGSDRFTWETVNISGAGIVITSPMKAQKKAINSIDYFVIWV